MDKNEKTSGIIIEDYIPESELAQKDNPEKEKASENSVSDEISSATNEEDNGSTEDPNKKKVEELLSKLARQENKESTNDSSNNNKKPKKPLIKEDYVVEEKIDAPQKDELLESEFNLSFETNGLENKDHDLTIEEKVVQDDVRFSNGSAYDQNILGDFAEVKQITEKQFKQQEKSALKEEYLRKKAELKHLKRQHKLEKKQKEKGYKNSYIYGFIFLVFSFILEIVSFARLGFGFAPANFGIEFGIILMLAGLVFIIPTEPAKITLCSLLFGVQLVMNVVNASLYQFCNDIVTLDMIFTLSGEAMNVFEFNQIDLGMLVLAVVIVGLYVMAIIFGNKYAPKFKINKNRKAIISLILLLVSVELIGYSTMVGFKFAYFNNASSLEIVDNNYYWYESTNSKFTSYKKFGFWSFYISNAKVFWGYDKTLNEKEQENLKLFIDSGANYKTENSTYNGKNVSGALSGDNLIVIMMESVEWFAIDEYNTPKLYSFINNEALKFNNFYSRNKTNISEQISLLGSVPNKYSMETINQKVDINVPNSLPNLFKDSGYESVNFFHNYLGNIYSRNTINKKIGFDKIYTLEDYSKDTSGQFIGGYLDDGKYIDEFLAEFMPRDKSFFSFFTTMTTHGPYNKTNPALQDYYTDFENNYEDYKVYAQSQGWKAPDKNTKEYNLLKEYKARAIALEKAFEKIINYLNGSDGGESIKDKTTIVLYTDHNAYYSDMTTIGKGISKFNKGKEQYNVPLVIYNSKLGNGEVDTFCSTYDIYPTICDLYGLNYNSSLTQGYSVFSKDIENAVFVSWMAGMFDENYYTSTLDDYTAVNKNLQTNSKLVQFKQKLNSFFEKQDYIDMYYQINYEKNLANK